MNVYVWEYIDKCSSNYHKGGGVVVFAQSLERAVQLAAVKGAEIHPNEIPDDIREVAGGVEAVYVMPDAGCC